MAYTARIMLDREACERRVFRLATLLCGDPDVALQVTADVVNARLDPVELDSVHLDRLTVLRCREAAPASSSRILASESLPEVLARAWASLTPQQRETWIFRRIYRVADRETARSMDCSVTAAARHLDQADAVMRGRGGMSAEEAAEALLQFTLAIDVPHVFRAKLRRQARWRRIVRWLAVGLVLAVLAAATLLWRAAVERADDVDPAPAVAEPAS